MAETFSYANLPGYGATENMYLTDLQKQRMGYWTGQKGERLKSINDLWNQKFNYLETIKQQDFNTALQQEVATGQLKAGVQKGFQDMTGGMSKKESMFNNPSKSPIHDWWKKQAYKRTGLGQHGISVPDSNIFLKNSPLVQKGITQKWITPEQMMQNSDFAMTSQFITNKAGDMVLNPNYKGNSFANFMANAPNTGFGKFSNLLAGKFATGVGLIGTGIKMFGGDNDPTTYTSTEKLGDIASWGATGAKVGAMINPYLAIPLAIAGAWGATSYSQKKADEAKAIMDEHRRKWEESLKEFRIDQRDASKIGGTAPMGMNWWTTTYS